MAIYDSYRLRYNTELGSLEMNTGGETWALVPTTVAEVLGTPLTGYSSGAGSVAATDTILQGINKLNGNTALKATAGPIGSSGLTQTTGKLLGRTTATDGAVEGITVGGGLTLDTGAVGLSVATTQSIFMAIAGDVGTPVEGQVWYDTVAHLWRGYNGTAKGTFTFVADI